MISLRVVNLTAVFLFFFAICSVALAAPASKGNPKSMALNEKGVSAATAKQYKVAEKLFKDALKIDEGNLTAVFNLASMYLANQKESSAVALLESYTVKMPNDPGLQARLGDAYFASRNIDSALTYYSKAIELDPTYQGVHAKLSTIYSLKNQLDMAERMALRAIELEPKNGQILANLSSIFLANNKPEKAISTAKRALQVKASSEVYITLGSAYETLQDYNSSLIAFKRAADLGDDTDELGEKIEAIKKKIG